MRAGNIDQVIERANGDACITKPFHVSDLLRALRILQQIVDEGAASQPFPRGFRLLKRDHSLLWTAVNV
jgi:hypothetical protein